MNKRKLVLLALSLCMVAILAVGGSLAYFWDTDSKTNVFTVGDVYIDLWEDFDVEDPDGTAKDGIAELHPVTYDKDRNRRTDNVIEKEVYVTNTGSEDAYVRVHIAIPEVLDNGRPDFDASQNVLHFNYDEDSLGEYKWDWSNAVDDGKYVGNWNFYETTIKDDVVVSYDAAGKPVTQKRDIKYNVYVVTYRDILSKDEETVDAMSQVYLDSEVSNSDITSIKNTLGEEWHIHVIAEGCQAKGFEDAYEALNTSFGDPSDSEYTDSINWEAQTQGTIDKTLAPKD